MTDEDRDRFAELMLGVGEVYGEPVSDMRMELYWHALDDLPLEAVRAAAHAHVRTSKFFPRPSELRTSVDGSDEDRAEVAWMALLREVRRVGWCGTPDFDDPILHRAALDLYGGWQALCERLPATGPEFLGAAKLFKSSYQAYARRDAREALMLPPSRDEARAALADLRQALQQRGLPTTGLD